MCEKCLSAVQRFYPELSEADQVELLWSATAFPFGSPEHLEKQLAELRQNTDGTLAGAIAYADAKLDRDILNRKVAP